MKDKEKKPTKRDYKEKRPPIETNGMGFSELLKRLSNTDPKESDKPKRTN
jgi:hypothetical protein